METTTRRRFTRQELDTWRAMLDTTTELRRLVGAQLQEANLRAGDHAVLLALTDAEGRSIRSSELASAVDWERSRLSHHLGRMEKRGLVRREHCATDSRGAEITITPEGARSLRDANAPHFRAVKRYFADALTPEQVDALADVLSSLRRHLDEVGGRP